jgi:hypothetical protein
MSDRGAAKELKITKKIFIDIAKRRQVTGSVATASTALALYTGRFIAKSLNVSNPTTTSQTVQIQDGSTVLFNFTIAAGAVWSVWDIDLPFYTSVTFNSSSTSVIFTSGGFVP